MVKGQYKYGLPNDMHCFVGEIQTGTMVWVSPTDYPITQGVCIGFQKVGDYLPIIEFTIDTYSGKKVISNAFSYHRLGLVTLAQFREERIDKILND
jgi:hypothetical protein